MRAAFFHHALFIFHNLKFCLIVERFIFAYRNNLFHIEKKF